MTYNTSPRFWNLFLPRVSFQCIWVIKTCSLLPAEPLSDPGKNYILFQFCFKLTRNTKAMNHIPDIPDKELDLMYRADMPKVGEGEKGK